MGSATVPVDYRDATAMLTWRIKEEEGSGTGLPGDGYSSSSATGYYGHGTGLSDYCTVLHGAGLFEP